MNIFQRIKNRFNPTNGEKRSIISRRFIIAISIIYSLLIIAFAFSFHYTMHKNRAILRESIVAHNQHAILQSLDSLAERIRGGSGKTIEDLKAELVRHNAAGGDILSGLFFTKTEDENFFRIAGTLSFDRGFTLKVPRSGVFREQKEINYLKKGVRHSIVDPDVYSQGPSDW